MQREGYRVQRIVWGYVAVLLFNDKKRSTLWLYLPFGLAADAFEKNGPNRSTLLYSAINDNGRGLVPGGRRHHAWQDGLFLSRSMVFWLAMLVST